jgi:hypothetical protein
LLQITQRFRNREGGRGHVKRAHKSRQRRRGESFVNDDSLVMLVEFLTYFLNRSKAG